MLFKNVEIGERFKLNNGPLATFVKVGKMCGKNEETNELTLVYDTTEVYSELDAGEEYEMGITEKDTF